MSLKTSWFTKSRRAQNVNDFETWIEGGVAPTLNAMDNNGEAFATVLIIDGTRVNDVRVYEDGIVPTVTSRYGTGGGNVPMVFEPKSAFEENWAESKVKNALRANASKSSHAVVFPIQDGREIEKNQNGSGLGGENAPAYTLDRTDGQSVAIPIQGTVIGRADTSGPQGKGYSEDGSPMFTLDRVSGHGIATASVVRRLTPVECERLQGFPDNWTDGQADSHRYKQMGNAVAVPVVDWIVGNICAIV